MKEEARVPMLTITPENGLKRYMQQVHAIPMMTMEEEFMMAKRWKEHGDVSAAHRLVTSHLRLVTKVAFGYRGYGLPVGELIAEGNIGLMQAVKKFDPDKGFRLTTYALWWIKASMQEYILRMWSLVKVGTSGAHKRLFFNLRKIKKQMRIMDSGDLSDEAVKEIALKLDVAADEVVAMHRRMHAHDQHLNQAIGPDSEDEWIDRLVEPSDSQETILVEQEERTTRRSLLMRALAKLNPREREILQKRRLQDEPVTLEDLSHVHNISRERIRQIENRAFEKLQKEMQALQKDAA